MFQADAVHSTTAPGTPAEPDISPPTLNTGGKQPPQNARQLLELAVECLIAFIDLLDPDPDLEDNGDAEEEPDREQSLGWQNPALGLQHGLDQDRLSGNTWEDGELEPSLGWSDMEARYGRYEKTALTHLEDEHDGGEPDHDNESTLGWSANIDQSVLPISWHEDAEFSLGWQNEGGQTRLVVGSGDLEEQCEDEGAEHDGREHDQQSWPNPMAENRIGEERS